MGNLRGGTPSRRAVIAELAPADSEPEKLPFDQWVVR